MEPKPEVKEVSVESVERAVQNALGLTRLRLATELQRVAEKSGAQINTNQIKALLDAIDVSGNALQGSMIVSNAAMRQSDPDPTPVATDDSVASPVLG